MLSLITTPFGVGLSRGISPQCQNLFLLLARTYTHTVHVFIVFAQSSIEEYIWVFITRAWKVEGLRERFVNLLFLEIHTHTHIHEKGYYGLLSTMLSTVYTWMSSALEGVNSFVLCTN